MTKEELTDEEMEMTDEEMTEEEMTEEEIEKQVDAMMERAWPKLRLRMKKRRNDFLRRTEEQLMGKGGRSRSREAVLR